MKNVFTLMLLVCTVIYSSAQAGSYSVRGFSDISSDTVFRGMSSQGEFLVGNASGSYLWTIENGLSPLSEHSFGDIGNGNPYPAEKISLGGSFAVGKSSSTYATILWTSENGSENLHELVGVTEPTWIWAESISDNGVVVGSIRNENDFGQPYLQAFIYNSQTDNTTLLGPASGYHFASGISRDGTIVTGSYEQVPFWWTQQQGIQFLEHPDIPFLQIPEDRVSGVLDVSDNGTVMVGYSGSPFEAVATIWKDGTSIILSDVENNSFATSVSGDGTIVVGDEFTYGVPNQRTAFIWDQANGNRYLQDVLTTAGIDLGGWYLNQALAISSDGSTITGGGINPDGSFEYWVATIPEPTTVSLLALGGLALLRKRK